MRWATWVVKVLEVWKTVKHATWGYERMPLTPSSPRKYLSSRRFLGLIFDYLSMVAKIKLCSYWCFHEQITMTVLLEYVTALLEYLGFLLQGMHRPKSGGVISTTYTKHIYHQFLLSWI